MLLVFGSLSDTDLATNAAVRPIIDTHDKILLIRMRFMLSSNFLFLFSYLHLEVSLFACFFIFIVCCILSSSSFFL